MKKIKMSKKILVLILCLAILFSQSLMALADDGTKDPTITAVSTDLEGEITEAVTDQAVEEITEASTDEVPEALAEEPVVEVVEETIEGSMEVSADELIEESTDEAAEDPVDVPTEGAAEEEIPITVFNYESEEVNVVVTLTDPADLPDNAELVVTPIALEEEVEASIIDAAYYDDEKVVQEILAFDIKFMADGAEVQPGDTVKVAVSLPEMEEAQALVYHLDENNDIENMDGVIDENGDIVFETPHFSTYVILPTDDINDAGSFSGYGLLGSSRASSGVLEYNKTAKVDDWDERTYDVEITAKSILTETTEKYSISDYMLVIDMSGSMRYKLDADEVKLAHYELVGKYNAVKSSLDTSKLYIITSNTYYTDTSSSTSSYDPDEKRLYTLAYLNYADNPGWYYYDNGTSNMNATIPGEGRYDASLWKSADTSTVANWYVHTWDNSRLQTMKHVAIAYMNTVATKSPQSYFGISTFYNDNTGYLLNPYSTISSNGQLDIELLKHFAAVRSQSGWCTYPNEGLEVAFRQMVSSNAVYNANTGTVTVGTYNAAYKRVVNGETVPQYVILLSDGEPDAPSNDSYYVPLIKKEAKAWADAFKAAGVTVYTVAFSTNTANKAWLTSDIASPGCTKVANNASELEAVFAAIRTETSSRVEYVTVDVKDYVDDRFVILDENGVQITENYPGIENGVKITTIGKDGDTSVNRTGTVYYDSEGRQYIVWEDQKAMKDGSSWTIKVQAREDYIGGNDVATNIDGISIIDAGDYGSFDLPDPVVNVKATMEVGNNNVYIYKGTAAPIDWSASTDPLTMYKAAKEDIAAYLAPGYEGVEESDFILKWYTDAGCTTEINMENMDDNGLNSETNYYLKFTYDPGSTSAESNANTTKNGTTYISGRDDGSDNGIVEAVNKDDSSKQYGIYNIKLWQIVKRSSSDANLPLEGVEFTITGDKTYYGKSDANGFVALYTDAAFTMPALDTPIGTYTLAETKTVEGYALSDETWEINASYSNVNGADVTSSTGNPVLKETPSGVVASYVYVNNPFVYELPGTGGSGIYWYMIAGVVLLMGGSVVVYRKRCKEVLRRR